MGISKKNAWLFGSGLPGTPETALYRELKRGNGYKPAGPSTRPSLTAKDVNLLEIPNDPLGGINTKAQSGLEGALGRLNTQAAGSAMASGRTMGSYQGQEMGRAKLSASEGIRNSLAGVLGASSLADRKNQQEYEDNVALAEEIGALNKPSVLEQILSYGGSAAQAGAGFKGYYDSIGKKRAERPSLDSGLNLRSSGNPYSVNQNDYFPDGRYEPYDYERYWR